MHPCSAPANRASSAPASRPTPRHRPTRGPRRLPSRRAGALALLALPALLLMPGCDLSFDEQEVHSRYDAGTDTLEVLLIYKGICPGKKDREEDEKLQRGIDSLRRLLSGRREFMIVDWPLYWPIDAWRDEAREELSEIDTRPGGPEEGDEADRREAQLALSLYEHFELVSFSLFLHEGELCGYQLIRVKGLQEAVATGNRLIHEAVREMQSRGEYARDIEEGDLDQRSVDLMVARARRETPWFTLDQRGLRVDIPLSRKRGEEFRRELIRGLMDLDVDDDDAPFIHLLAEVSTIVRSLEFPGESIVVTLGGADPRRLDLDIDVPGSKASPELLARVRHEGLAIDEKLSLDQVRALIPGDAR